MLPLRGLKVAYAAFEPFPNQKGSGVRITEMTRALAEAGAEVTLLTLGTERASLPNIQHSPLALIEHNYLSRALAFRGAVGRALYALRPDVIHFRGPFEGMAAVAQAERTKARAIFEVNGLPSVELRYHYPTVASAVGFEGKTRAIEQRVLSAVDLVVTQSQATMRFVKMRVPGVRGEVIPNGANPTLFQPPASDAKKEVPQLLYAGSLAPWQGLLDLLAALRQVRREMPVALTIIGPGRRAWQKALLRQAKQHKLADAVRLLGPTDQSGLARAIQESDICVAPLRRDRRNRVQGCSPIKIFEYMAAGRAVISTDLPCICEIINPGLTGLLAKPSNPHRLRDALLELLAQPALCTSLGRRARDQIEAEATWAHRRQRLVETYQNLL